jgi:hypothetical protein
LIGCRRRGRAGGIRRHPRRDPRQGDGCFGPYRPIAARACHAFDKGLLATTLRYHYEVRDQAPYFEDISDLKLPADMKQLAAHIVDSKTSHFDPSTFVDAPGHQFHGCAAGEYRRRQEEAGRGKHESPSPNNWKNCQKENGTLKPKPEPDASSLQGGNIAFTGRLASMTRAVIRPSWPGETFSCERKKGKAPPS